MFFEVCLLRTYRSYANRKIKRKKRHVTLEFVKSLTAEKEFSTLKGGRIIYAVFVAYKSQKISGIKVRKFNLFEETRFVTSLKKQCHVTFEINRNPFFLWGKKTL